MMCSAVCSLPILGDSIFEESQKVVTESCARPQQLSFYDVWNRDPIFTRWAPDGSNLDWSEMYRNSSDCGSKLKFPVVLNYWWSFLETKQNPAYRLDQKSNPVAPPTPYPLAWILPLAKVRVGSEMFGWDVLQMLCTECSRQARCVWMRIPVGIWWITTV